MTYQEINQAVGNVDVYLLDQILKGRFTPPARVLDAGCGEGRNLPYFIRNGFDVWGVDSNPSAVRMVQMFGKSMHPTFDPEKFMASDVADMPFPPESFDTVISSAVLHFAKDEIAFSNMLQEMVRVLKPAGILFIRVATTCGVENEIEPLGNQWYKLKDGSKFFLATRELLDESCRKLSLSYLEPFKTVVVDRIRSMGVLILQKQTVK